MKKSLFLIAASLFLLSCGGNDRNRSDTNDRDNSHMEGHGDEGFHKKHVADLHNAMDVMDKDLRMKEFSGDADYDFALIMKRHHQGAVDMANCMIDNGESAEMKAFATKVRDRQLHDIREFDLIIQDKTNAKGDSDFGKRSMAMIPSLNDVKGDETIDNTYAALMMAHHRDEIKIATEYLREKGKHPKMAQIATEITNLYPVEIKEMEGLIK